MSAIQTRAPRLLIGRDATLIDGLTRLLPVKYWRLIRDSLEATNV